MTKSKILVVEDEGIVALDICQTLESLGYEVAAHVDTAEQVLATAKKLKPDIVLMDINLKGEMDGIDAAAQLYKESPAPVIFLTAHADEATLQRAKVTHPYGYILKPFESNDLRATIEVALFRKETEGTKPEEDVEVESQFNFEKIDSDKVTIATSVLHQVSLFKALPANVIQDLASQCSVKTLDSGESITEGQEELPYGFVVLSGRLIVSKTSAGGKELSVDLLPPGDCYGAAAVLADTRLETAIRAQAPSKILIMSKAVLTTIAKQNPQLHQAVSQELAKRLANSQELSISLAHAKVETRIAATLIALTPRIGKDSAVKGQPRIYLTRKELADLTGTTPETAIRVTKNLERENVLDLTKPGIIKILSLDSLNNLVTQSAV